MEQEDMLRRQDMLKAISNVYPVIVSADLTKNTYMKLEYKPILSEEKVSFGVFDDLIQMWIPGMEPGFQKLFLNTFSRDALIKKCLDGEKDVYQEIKQVCFDGEEHWLEIHVIFISEKESDLKEICFIRTIDDKKEEELKWKRQFITMNNEIRKHEISLRKALEYEKMTNECLNMFYKVTNLKESLERFMKLTGKNFQADRSFVCEIHKEKVFHAIEFCADGVLPKGEFVRGLDISIFQYWIPQLLQEQYIYVKDVEDMPEEEKLLKELLAKHKITSLFFAPVIFDGEMRLVLGYDNPKLDDENSLPMLGTLAGMALAGINRVYMERKRNSLTYRDSLTNLWNRTRMNEDISLWQEKEENTGIFFLDVNGLKEMNDNFSHEAGDALLRAAAKIIKEQFPECETGNENWKERAYRIGGDEFIVWVRQTSEEKFLKKEQELRASYQDAEDCSVSIGGVFDKKPGDIYKMIKKADHLMYEDKKEYYKEHDRRTYK